MSPARRLPRKSRPRPRAEPPDDRPLLRFSTLPTVRLDQLSSLIAKHGELLYQRLVGLRMVECRILGVVAYVGPVTLKDLCAEVGIDKGQGSRLVTQLLAAGLLDRHEASSDQRSFHLLLTPAGRRVHARIADAAVARNEHWMAALPEDHRALFSGCIDLLTQQAQQMLEDESRRSRRPAPSSAAPKAGDPAADGERPLVVAPSALRELHRRLGELLGEP